MPENGTSLIRLTLRPVKNARKPSLAYILRHASIAPLYSLKPTTSSLVLTIIIGLANTDYILFVNAPADIYIYVSVRNLDLLRNCSI